MRNTKKSVFLSEQTLTASQITARQQRRRTAAVTPEPQNLANNSLSAIATDSDDDKASPVPVLIPTPPRIPVASASTTTRRRIGIPTVIPASPISNNNGTSTQQLPPQLPDNNFEFSTMDTGTKKLPSLD